MKNYALCRCEEVRSNSRINHGKGVTFKPQRLIIVDEGIQCGDCLGFYKYEGRYLINDGLFASSILLNTFKKESTGGVKK